MELDTATSCSMVVCLNNLLMSNLKVVLAAVSINYLGFAQSVSHVMMWTMKRPDLRVIGVIGEGERDCK